MTPETKRICQSYTIQQPEARVQAILETRQILALHTEDPPLLDRSIEKFLKSMQTSTAQVLQCLQKGADPFQLDGETYEYLFGSTRARDALLIGRYTPPIRNLSKAWKDTFRTAQKLKHLGFVTEDIAEYALNTSLRAKILQHSLNVEEVLQILEETSEKAA